MTLPGPPATTQPMRRSWRMSAPFLLAAARNRGFAASGRSRICSVTSQQQAAELRAIASGQPFIPEAADDENAINAREATKRASNSWAEIVTEVEQTNAGLRPLLNDPGETNARYLIHDHWEEHGAHIRAWKEANGV